MIMEESYKEVYFDQYCKTCKYDNLPEHYYPCHNCLDNPVNAYSHKPVYYKHVNEEWEKEKYEKEKDKYYRGVK